MIIAFRKISLQWLALASLTVAATGPASLLSAAESYPTKPIKLIVPFPAGGPSDVGARRIGQLLSVRLGQQMVIENRPGASGAIAMQVVAKAPADGYTLLYCNNATHSANVALFPQQQRVPLDDFTPIVRLAIGPFILLVHPSLPVHTIRELTALAKAKPDRLRYGSAGVATFTHLAGELLAHETGIKLIHVPYKGGAPAVIDAIGGHVDMVYTTPVDALPYVRAGQLRAVAITGPRRIVVLPDVPTMAESGVQDAEVLGWAGLCAPKGTPPAVIRKLNGEALSAYLAPSVKSNLEMQGLEITANTPEEFADFIKADIARTVTLVNKLGIRAE